MKQTAGPHPFPADQVLTPRPSRLPALGPDRLFRLHLSLLQMRFCCSTHLSLLPSSHTSSQCSLCQKRPPPVVRLQVPAPTSPTLPAPPRSRGGTMPSAPRTLASLSRRSVPLPCRVQMCVFLPPPPKVPQVKYFCSRSSIPAILLRHGCATGAPAADPGLLAPTPSLRPPCPSSPATAPHLPSSALPCCQFLDLPCPTPSATLRRRSWNPLCRALLMLAPSLPSADMRLL